MKRLIGYITSEPGFERLSVSDSGFGASHLSLPEIAGRAILFEICLQRLQTETDRERRRILRYVMSANGDIAVLMETWKDLDCGPITYDRLQEAIDFGIIDRFSSSEIDAFTAHEIELRMRWYTYIGRLQSIVKDPILYNSACKEFFDGGIAFFRPPRPEREHTHLEVLSTFLSLHGLAHLITSQTGRQAASVVAERSFGFSRRGSIFDEYRDSGHVDDDPIAQFTSMVVRLMNRDVEDWKKGLDRWETLVDRGLEVSEGGLVFQQIAAMSTATAAEEEECAWDDDAFLPSRGLVRRLCYARRMAENADWWRRELNRSDNEGRVIGLAVLLGWGGPEVLRTLGPTCEPMIESLGKDEWARLRSGVEWIVLAAGDLLPELPDSSFDTQSVGPTRLWSALIGRIRDNDRRRLLSRRVFAEYDGDDETILQEASDNELFLSKKGAEGVDWAYVGRLSRRARSVGLSHTFSVPWPAEDWGIPDDIAKDVLANCDSYSGQFVAMCERSYASSVAKNAPSVSAVAIKDKWFSTEGVC